MEKIVQIRAGMSSSQVSATLGIDPYNILHLNDEGGIILTYNYRLKNRVMNINSTNRDVFERQTRNEDSQTAGSTWYDKQYQTVFVLFSDNKVKAYISNVGKRDSEFLVITANNIAIATKGELSSYDPEKDVIPLIYRINRGEIEIKSNGRNHFAYRKGFKKKCYFYQ